MIPPIQAMIPQLPCSVPRVLYYTSLYWPFDKFILWIKKNIWCCRQWDGRVGASMSSNSWVGRTACTWSWEPRVPPLSPSRQCPRCSTPWTPPRDLRRFSANEAWCWATSHRILHDQARCDFIQISARLRRSRKLYHMWGRNNRIGKPSH